MRGTQQAVENSRLATVEPGSLSICQPGKANSATVRFKKGVVNRQGRREAACTHETLSRSYLSFFFPLTLSPTLFLPDQCDTSTYSLRDTISGLLTTGDLDSRFHYSAREGAKVVDTSGSAARRNPARGIFLLLEQTRDIGARQSLCQIRDDRIPFFV